MKNKELKKMSRAELLELLLDQTKEAEQLRERLEEAQARLAERDLRLQNAGDLAHAVLEINGVMEAAQAAARQYVDNMAAMEARTRTECEKLLSDAREEAARIRGDGL